jgi:HEAT repeat protein
MQRGEFQHGRRDFLSMRWILTALASLAIAWPVLAAESPATSTAPTATTPAELLLQVTSPPDANVRHQAAMAIVQLRTPDAVKAIAALLDNPNNDAAKLAIVEALTHTQSADLDLLPHLLALLEQKDPVLRKAAIDALSHYRDPATVAKIKTTIQEREAAWLAENHTALMKALYESTAEADRPALLLSWLKQLVVLERRTALDIVQQALRKGTSDGPILEYVRTMLNDPDETIRQKVVLVLRTRGLREDAARIQTMLQHDQPPVVRDAIYNALGVLGDPASIPSAIEGLKDQVESVAAEAATTLGKLCELQPAPAKALLAAAVDALLQRCASPIENAGLREHVIEAMSHIAHPSFLPVLSRYAVADEPVPAVRQAALRGLGRINDPESINLVLERMTGDSDAGVREAAVEALGRMGISPDHLKALRERLDPKVEAAVAVQNKVWESYALIFMKLSPAEQKAVLDSWEEPNLSPPGRRIELLTHIEKVMTTAKIDPRRLADIREQLGDDLLATSRPADAVSVLARGLEIMPAVQQERRLRCALKLIVAHLRTPTPEQAITLAGNSDIPMLKPAAAALLLKFAQDLSTSNAQAAGEFLYKLKQTVPDQFGPDWAKKFSAILINLPVSQPATAPAK